MNDEEILALLLTNKLHGNKPIGDWIMIFSTIIIRLITYFYAKGLLSLADTKEILK